MLLFNDTVNAKNLLVFARLGLYYMEDDKIYSRARGSLGSLGSLEILIR